MECWSVGKTQYSSTPTPHHSDLIADNLFVSPLVFDLLRTTNIK